MIEFAKNHRPLILVTNDDGIDAGGIKALAEVACEIGNVLVVAPRAPHSGMSHAITVREPLYLERVHQEDNLIMYRTNGTPADCVKLAMNSLLDRKPDILLSGINHGSNSSASVHYSGTLGAAREGVLNGLPSVGFSMLDYNADADFSAAKPLCRQITMQVIEHGLPADTFLNVNIPKGKDINGIRVCRQTKGKWLEEFVEHKDPRGEKYYWLTGSFQNLEPNAEDTDEYALVNGYASIVPCKSDITDYDLMEQLKAQDYEKEAIRSSLPAGRQER